jgi:hypothetical protein
MGSHSLLITVLLWDKQHFGSSVTPVPYKPGLRYGLRVPPKPVPRPESENNTPAPTYTKEQQAPGVKEEQKNRKEFPYSSSS